MIRSHFKTPISAVNGSFPVWPASLKLNIFSKYACVVAPCQPTKLHVLTTKAGCETTSIQSHRKHYPFLSLRALRAFVVKSLQIRNSQFAIRNCLKPGFASGLSLIEIMIAIGILAVSMMLIAAAFPAGVAMSIAVSDETTSQAVFEQAISVIRDNYSISEINVINPLDLPSTTDYSLISNRYLGKDSGGNYDPGIGLDNRSYKVIAGQASVFSWSALIKRMQTSGPMGNLCQIIIVVSRKPSGSPNFLDNADPRQNSDIPELRSVPCVDSVPAERTIEVDSGPDSSEPANLPYFDRVPASGYMIDGETGTVYSIISRNDGASKTVTLLTEAADITTPRNFWVVPGPYDGSYGRSSPAVRVFNAMLYLP